MLGYIMFLSCLEFAVLNSRDLTEAGWQLDDGGQNYLVKTSYCKESLSSIIHHTKSIQLKKEQCMASRI